MTTPAGWDGGAYDAIARPQRDAGARTVDRLEIEDGSVVVDAGCGSGRVTERILDRHPTVSVIAIDASASMSATAAERLVRYAGRVRLVQADLAQPWPLSQPADAIVSTSAFHWVLDHERLFSAAHAVCDRADR